MGGRGASSAGHNGRSQNGKISEQNYFMGTTAKFDETDRPKAAPDYISDSGSAYWYSKDGVIRGADHWGAGVASCDWYLGNSRESSWLDKNGMRYGKAKWGAFTLKDFELAVYGEGTELDVMGTPFHVVQITPKLLKDGYVYYKNKKTKFNHSMFMSVEL